MLLQNVTYNSISHSAAELIEFESCLNASEQAGLYYESYHKALMLGTRKGYTGSRSSFICRIYLSAVGTKMLNAIRRNAFILQIYLSRCRTAFRASLSSSPASVEKWICKFVADVMFESDGKTEFSALSCTRPFLSLISQSSLINIA